MSTHDSIETQSSADSSVIHILRQAFRITGKSETAETLHLWVFDTNKEGTPLAIYAEKMVSNKDTQTIAKINNDSTAGRTISTKTTREGYKSQSDKLVQLDEVTCTGKTTHNCILWPILLLLLLFIIVYKLIQRIRK